MSIKLIAFDLDGTLSQHKTPVPPENRATMEALSKKYKLLMSGAGLCRRIFEQMEHFPVDILGSYGMQYAEYNPETGDIEIRHDLTFPFDKESIEARVTMLREKYGYTEFAGDNVEYHASGCFTFPLLGTKAKQEDKLAFDPDRAKRRAIFADVTEVFSDYNVFLGGSSSFDMAPKPYNKATALEKYAEAHGFAKEEVAYVGDDYGLGGNDEPVFLAGYRFFKVDDYRNFPEIVAELL